MSTTAQASYLAPLANSKVVQLGAGAELRSECETIFQKLSQIVKFFSSVFCCRCLSFFFPLFRSILISWVFNVGLIRSHPTLPKNVKSVSKKFHLQQKFVSLRFFWCQLASKNSVVTSPNQKCFWAQTGKNSTNIFEWISSLIRPEGWITFLPFTEPTKGYS